MTVAWPYDVAADPAPGDPDRLRATAACAGRTAHQLSASAAALRSVAADDALWTGTAAAAFRARLGALPRDLDRAAAALADVERALVGYACFLAEAQTRARSLAAQWSAATSAGAGAAADLSDWYARADSLADEVVTASRRAEAAVRHAAAAAPHEPTWLAQLAHTVDHAVGEFVRKHVAAINVALDVIAVVQVAALFVTPLAPLALALTAVSVVATLTLQHYGKASTGDVVMAFTGAVAGPAAKAAEAERLVTSVVALAPEAAAAATTRAVRAVQPVAAGALQNADDTMTLQGGVTAAQDLAARAVSAGRPALCPAPPKRSPKRAVAV